MVEVLPPRQIDEEEEEELVMSFEPPPKKELPHEPPKETVPEQVEYDEFGLPIRKPPKRVVYEDEYSDEEKDNKLEAKSDSEPERQEANITSDITVSENPPSPIAAAPITLKIEDESPPTPRAKDAERPLEEPAQVPPTDSVVSRENRESMMSLPDEDIRKNAVKMFSENPADPKMETVAVSEWSHQQIVPRREQGADTNEAKAEESDDEWQTMPAYASEDLYDDDGKLIAVAHEGSDDEDAGKEGASKGYTRVFDDEDADSVTSMDENTKYLFNEDENDDASRNPLSQMEATKELLTEGQRIAYVGICRLALAEMVKDLEKIEVNRRSAKKSMGIIRDSMRMWSQKMMVRLYTHMEISPPEQIMIEQLAEHGVVPSDLTPTLLKNFRVHNPMASHPSSLPTSPRNSQRESFHGKNSPMSSPMRGSRSSLSPSLDGPPPYEAENLEAVKNPTEIMEKRTLDIDLRWTVLCDLFLVLIADSVYDARARTLLERVGAMLDVSWKDICKFEKRVTDALEMQESAEQNWSEAEHIQNRDKAARNKRFMMLGLATVGGGLVIGLSGGLLAPMIGAGLAAGFTTIGVAGTTGFLAGTGGTALIASGAVVSGSVIGGKAGFNRMKSVKTFEFKPLHNAKRVNLIITIAGWMNGKVDDVRLPFSTVDPIMGDLLSVHWEPEMLQSMGQTINILATEVLTQSLQQVLGSTILVALMASLQLPVVLAKLSYLLDNPWSVSLDRAQGAGLILADTLVNRNLGVRPVTLVGYSLGARVIYYCLRELARIGAGGLIQNVYLFGSPVVVKKDEYAQAVAVVSGRFVNGYATNDWILGYLFRATSGGLGRVAGLAPVSDVPGVENVDVTELVPGHMAYRQAMPKVLRHVGWEVTSDEFSEIEDPDPENHQERQRQLINELEEARKESEKKPERKPLFGIFSRKEATKKKDWETYDLNSEHKNATSTTNGTHSNDGNVLFDLDAIRAEIAKDSGNEEIISIKEIESTMPTLKIEDPKDSLRQTKSANDVTGYGSISTFEGRGYDSFELDHAEEEEAQLTFEPLPVATRPELHTSYTAPVQASVGGKNIWADDYYDDDEFAPKEEGEMTLTFA